MAIATAGNLSITQTALSLLHEGLLESRDRRAGDARRRAHHVPRRPAGRPRDPQGAQDIGAALEAEHISSDVSLLFGGQIARRADAAVT